MIINSLSERMCFVNIEGKYELIYALFGFSADVVWPMCIGGSSGDKERKRDEESAKCKQ